MDVVIAAVGLVIVALGSVVVVIALRGRASMTSADGGGPALAVVSLAAVGALASSVMYFSYGVGGTTVALAAGDATMVLGPGLLWLALRMLHGGRGAGWLVLLCALATGLTTLLASAPAGAALKVIVLLAFSVAGAFEAFGSPFRRLVGMRIIGTTFAAYAVFCAARILTAALGGVESAAFRSLFSVGPTTVVGVFAVVSMTIGVALVLRALRATAASGDVERFATSARTVLTRERALAWVRVDLVDIGLLRAADQRERADEVAAALREAGRAAYGKDATLTVEDGIVAVTTLADAPDGEHRLRAGFADGIARIDPSLADALRVEIRTIDSAPALAAALRSVRADAGARGRR